MSLITKQVWTQSINTDFTIYAEMGLSDVSILLTSGSGQLSGSIQADIYPSIPIDLVVGVPVNISAGSPSLLDKIFITLTGTAILIGK